MCQKSLSQSALVTICSLSSLVNVISIYYMVREDIHGKRLVKLRDAIAISKSETITHSLTHSGGSDHTMNSLVYIPTHHSELEKKGKSVG